MINSVARELVRHTENSEVTRISESIPRLQSNLEFSKQLANQPTTIVGGGSISDSILTFRHSMQPEHDFVALRE